MYRGIYLYLTACFVSKTDAFHIETPNVPVRIIRSSGSQEKILCRQLIGYSGEICDGNIYGRLSPEVYSEIRSIFSSGEIHRLTTPGFDTSGLLDPGRKTKESLISKKDIKVLLYSLIPVDVNMVCT